MFQPPGVRFHSPYGRQVGQARPLSLNARSLPLTVRSSALLVALIVNLPIVYLVIRGVGSGSGAFSEVVAGRNLLPLFRRTLGLVAGVVPATVLLAVPLAWLVTRTDLRWRRGWALLLALPLVVPSYVAALSWVAVVGPRGTLEPMLEDLFGGLGQLAYGYSGAFLVLTFYTYPYVYLLVLAQIERLDPALEESARSLGASPGRVFATVVLPQLRPSILGGSLLVALYVASDFGAVSLVRYDTFTLAIYNAYRGLFDRSAAATLATVLVALTLGLVALDGFLQRRAGRRLLPSPRRPATRRRLGGWQVPLSIAVAAVVIASLGTVAVALGGWGRRLLVDGSALDLGRLAGAAATSVTYAGAAGLLAVAASLPVAWWSVRGRSRTGRLVERASYTGHALPGLVVALALVFLVTRLARPLYQTPAVLLIAYLVLFLPEALRAVRASLLAISPRLEEAARVLGRSPARVLTDLTLPMMREGLATGGVVVFLMTMKELPATLVLAPVGAETLAVRVWSTADEGIYSQAVPPAVLLLAVTAPVVYLFVVRPVLRGGGAARAGAGR